MELALTFLFLVHGWSWGPQSMHVWFVDFGSWSMADFPQHGRAFETTVKPKGVCGLPLLPQMTVNVAAQKTVKVDSLPPVALSSA